MKNILILSFSALISYPAFSQDIPLPPAPPAPPTATVTPAAADTHRTAEDSFPAKKKKIVEKVVTTTTTKEATTTGAREKRNRSYAKQQKRLHNKKLTSRKGEHYLPDSADLALGIDAVPVLNYFGNFFHGAGVNAAPTWGYPGTGLAITGKMFKTSNKAYRVMMRVSFGSSRNLNYVVKDDQPGVLDPTITVNDELKSTHYNIVAGGGIETRRGKTRLQGYYGWMGMAGAGGHKDEYSYGNNFSQTNPSPTSTNWSTDTASSVPARITKQKDGSTFMLGIRGFIGAEYFILPKISLGAEFGWGFGFSSTGDGSKTIAEWDGTNNQLKLTSTRTGRSSTLGFDTDVNGMQMMPAGALMLTLHF